MDNGWVMLSIWGLVCLAAYLLKILHKAIYAYRIKTGRKQMNDWLEYLGKHFDSSYREGIPYSKNAMKTWVAKVSVEYFKQVQDKSRE